MVEPDAEMRKMAQSTVAKK